MTQNFEAKLREFVNKKVIIEKTDGTIIEGTVTSWDFKHQSIIVDNIKFIRGSSIKEVTIISEE